MNTRILLPVAALIAAVGGIILALGTLRPATTGELELGVLLEKPRPVSAFSLTDDNGDRFDEGRLLGQWTAVFPGFTHCPDICPTTLGTLRAAMTSLTPEQRERWNIVFLTVDPQRDTPEVLAQYVGYFSEDFVGVTGHPDVIGQLTSDLSVAYRYTPNDAGGYTVDHTASVVLINPEGRVAGFLQPPLRPDALASDLQTAARS